jgi:hypothetical protein
MAVTYKDEYKVESLRVVVENGTAATTIDEDFSPDEGYQEIVGVATFENNDGGLTNGYFRTGLKDENKAYADLAHKSLLMGSANIAQKEKFMPINIPIRKKRDIQCRLSFDEALTEDLDVEFVFLLRRQVAVAQ